MRILHSYHAFNQLGRRHFWPTEADPDACSTDEGLREAGISQACD